MMMTSGLFVERQALLVGTYDGVSLSDKVGIRSKPRKQLGFGSGLRPENDRRRSRGVLHLAGSARVASRPPRR
jgi:hypothetical protein